MGEVSQQNLISLKEYIDNKFEAQKEIADLKVTHLRELREADQKALELVAKNNTLHFETLNENAKRTIEERSHFVSVEAFEPFKEAVNKRLNQAEGQSNGLSQGWGYLIGVIGITAGVVSIIYNIIG